jgi:hypothetical protein
VDRGLHNVDVPLRVNQHQRILTAAREFVFAEGLEYLLLVWEIPSEAHVFLVLNASTALVREIVWLTHVFDDVI